MPWYSYAFIAALFVSFSTLVEKKVLIHVHSKSFSSALAVSNFILSLPLLYFVDWSSLSTESLVYITASSLMAAIAFLLVAKGIRHLEISTVAPLLVLNPGAAAIAGFLFLNEHLSLLQTGGIVLMMIGSYLLATVEVGPKVPLRAFFSSKYVVLILVSILFYALGAALDRILVTDLLVSPLTYLFVAHFFTALIFLVFSIGWGRGVSGIREALSTHGNEIALMSIFTIAYRYFQLEAFQLAYVGLVSAIKRSSSFFTTLIGGELFHEHHVRAKACASLIIILGCFLIVWQF